MALESKTIRNVALLGHTSSGKTMLAEAMLKASGAIKELGSVDKGTTVSDAEPEEQKSGHSITLSTMYADWKGKSINIIDTPGYSDYAGMTLSALSATDLALITVNANTGIEVSTRKMWDAVGTMGIARGIIITRLDGDKANYETTLASIKEAFGSSCAPVTFPIGVGSSLDRVVDLIAGTDVPAEAEDIRFEMMESAVSADDALLEKYLEGEEIPPEELQSVIREAVISADMVPVFAVAGEADKGVTELLDFLADFGPTPFCARPRLEGGEDEDLRFTPAEEGPFVARIFRVLSDDYVGKVSLFRVYQGTLKTGDTIHFGDSSAKIQKLYRFQGHVQKEIDSCAAGQIAAVAKVEELHFGMTLTNGDDSIKLINPRIPKPMAQRAIEPKKRGDETKLSGAIRKLCDEDPTFRWKQDDQTGELVVAGMGDQHLKVMFDRMKRRFGLEVNTKPPKIAYRETITGEADIRYRHKKQSGGAGQFAEIQIKVTPNERGAGYEFIDDIFGGAIDQPFRPSVDKGIQSQMSKGILAGFQVVDLKVSLYDGKTHPVDSKDIAFQTAGRQAIKQAVKEANPVLLEPVVDMEVVVPSRFMGDITGDVSGRRGRITGMETLGDMQVVRAQVPASEVQSYGTELQSLTGGEGFFAMEFSHYDVVPSSVAKQIISQYKAEDEEE